MTNFLFLSFITLILAITVSYLIRKVFLYKRLMRSLDNVQMLGSDICSQLTEVNLYSKVIDAFSKTSLAEKISLMLFDSKTGQLVIEAGMGISPRAKRLVRLRPGEGISGKAYQTAQSVMIEDTRDTGDYVEFVRDHPRPSETVLALPLIFKSKPIGVITLSSAVGKIVFPAHVRASLEILAGHSAIAITNALLYKKAVTDEQTKLYLPKYFFYRLNEESERGKRYGFPVSLLILSVDDLKRYISEYGGDSEEVVTIYMARLLRKCTRRSDIQAILPEKGFAVILPQTDLKRAVVFADRLRRVIETYSRVAENMGARKEVSQEMGPRSPERLHKLTVSIGVTEYHKGETSRNTYSRAESLLVKAVMSGGNRVISEALAEATPAGSEDM